MDTKALFQLSYGLYVISASAEGKESGCVANTLAQVTSSPAQLSVALNKNNFTTELIEKSGRFAAVVLSKEADMGLIANFGFRSGRDADKFAEAEHRTDAAGVKYPTAGASAVFSCKVNRMVDLGTHLLFVADLEDCEILNSAEPMTYAYYHQVKKGTTPKNAPSYQEEKPKKHGFRCTVCGYFLEADTLPADYKCPICGVGADKFVEVSE